MFKVLVVGVGRMGFAHARACATLPDVKIVGLVARDFRKWQQVVEYFPEISLYNDFKEALHFTKPDAVIISSYTDTHALYACQAMEAGAHVFVEKPLALNKREAGYTIACARKYNKKLYVGYILHHHSMWKKFVQKAKSHEGPYQLTITSNQHSEGHDWELHKNILNAGLSPLADCGIHYTDLMSQTSDAEVIDIQSLLPFDLNHDTVKSVAKTNRLLVVDEDVPGGASAYLLQEIVENQNGYKHLDSKPQTLTAKAHRPAYGTDGDYFSKPSAEDIFEKVYEIMNEANPAKFKSLY